jgi:hypothetical protein
LTLLKKEWYFSHQFLTGYTVDNNSLYSSITSQQYFSLTPNCISYQPQPAILFSLNKSTPATSRSQPNKVNKREYFDMKWSVFLYINC